MSKVVKVRFTPNFVIKPFPSNNKKTQRKKEEEERNRDNNKKDMIDRMKKNASRKDSEGA